MKNITPCPPPCSPRRRRRRRVPRRFLAALPAVLVGLLREAGLAKPVQVLAAKAKHKRNEKQMCIAKRNRFQNKTQVAVSYVEAKSFSDPVHARILIRSAVATVCHAVAFLR